MATVEIPRDQWTVRLDEFTVRHDAWLVSVDVLTGMGALREFENLPLLGVSADRSSDGGTILMSAARAPNAHITHAVHGVTRVSLEQTAEGADAALLVDSADGTRTVLRFRTATLPETVDGVVRR